MATYSETPVHFKAHDGKTIYADLVKAVSKRNGALIIYAHGLPSARIDYTYLNSARQFARKGYDCLRMSFYDWRKGARCLTDCTLDTRRRDVETAVKKYRKAYSAIFIIGHSWGGLTTMHSRCEGVSAVSLWDPSYMSATWWPDFVCQRKGLLLGQGSFEFLLAKEMVQQALSLDKPACQKLAQKFSTPLQVLHAGAPGQFLHKLGESFHTHASGPTDYHLIKEADHSFLSEAAQKKAVALTARWFEKFID
jgi:alpha-beta hydrolase superfamily lysophospholipase